MADAVSLSFDPAQAAKVDALLGQFSLAPGRETSRLARGLARSLSRAAMSARTVMVRVVAQDLGIRQGDLKGYIRATPATPWKLEARVTALGARGIPLGKLNPTGPEPSRGKGAGVTVRARPSHFPHAFIATMRSRHRGVFERKGKARLPITELRTRSVTAVFRERRSVGYARASESLAKNLVSELKYALATGA